MHFRIVFTTLVASQLNGFRTTFTNVYLLHVLRINRDFTIHRLQILLKLHTFLHLVSTQNNTMRINSGKNTN